MSQTANTPKYEFSEWDQYRQQQAEYAQQISQSNEQEIAGAIAAGMPAPDPQPLPDVPPDLPPAFKEELIPELEDEGTIQKALQAVYEDYDGTLEWLKRIRRVKENDWALSMEYYDMVAELAYDEERRKSVQLSDKFKDLDEMEPERMALVLPFAYESVQLIGAHLYNTMRGRGPEYCEINGREKNDIEGAKRTEAFLNYQYSHEIPTSDVVSDYILDALKLGTGVKFHTWDTTRNRRREEILPRWNIWWDKASSMQDCKVVCVRREVSVGELYKLRNDPESPIWFESKDIETALAKVVNHCKPRVHQNEQDKEPTERETHTKENRVNPKYQRVWLDIMMHTEPNRWVYVVNESLVVGVTTPEIPDIPELDIESRFPISIFSPIRKRGDIDGDSFVVRILDVQDMSNAALALLIENLKSASVGVGLTSDDSLAGTKIRAGYWHQSMSPEKGNIMYPAANTQQILGLIDWLTSRVTDRVTGTTPEFRGQARYSGMPATAIRDLLEQGTSRMSPMEDRALFAMQDGYSVAITLNRLYLQPHKYFRVVGEQAVLPGRAPQGDPRGINASDIIGASGKDLVPTGFPGASSTIAQETLNEAAVIMQTGGNPRPLMREYVKVKYRGVINPDDVFPENGIGNDPIQENENLLAGMPISRDPDDIDPHHIQIHMMLQQDARFVQAAQMNPVLMVAWQSHMQQHMQAMQQQGLTMGGAPMQQGMGSGVGTSGLSTNMMGADPKMGGEIEAQMGAIG